jgi:hypothetical protein
MNYEYIAIPDSDIPRASLPVFQHMLDTYASETNKVISVWRCFDLADMSFRPHPQSRTVLDILKHQLLSERRFFGEFMTVPEPPPSEVLPIGETHRITACECGNWHMRAWDSLLHRPKHGGWRRFRFLMLLANGSG